MQRARPRCAWCRARACAPLALVRCAPPRGVRVRTLTMASHSTWLLLPDSTGLRMSSAPLISDGSCAQGKQHARATNAS